MHIGMRILIALMSLQVPSFILIWHTNYSYAYACFFFICVSYLFFMFKGPAPVCGIVLSSSIISFCVGVHACARYYGNHLILYYPLTDLISSGNLLSNIEEKITAEIIKNSLLLLTYAEWLLPLDFHTKREKERLEMTWEREFRAIIYKTAASRREIR